MSRSGIQRISLPAFKVIRLWQDNAWETARRVRLEAPLEAELERLMRYYLRHLLERDLKSADFLDRVRWDLAAAPSSKTAPGADSGQPADGPALTVQ